MTAGFSSLWLVSNAAAHRDGPHGTGLLPRRLTDEEFASAPVLVSVDALVIDDLDADSYDRFLAALAE